MLARYSIRCQRPQAIRDRDQVLPLKTFPDMKTSAPWKSAPISPTCEVLTDRAANRINETHGLCGKPTEYVYPTHGGGYMALCALHGQKHKNNPGTEKAADLIAKGETWA